MGPVPARQERSGKGRRLRHDRARPTGAIFRASMQKKQAKQPAF